MPLSRTALALLYGVGLVAVAPAQASAQGVAPSPDPYTRPATPAPGVMTVRQLEGLEVYAREGEVIGRIRQVLAGPDGRALVILGYGAAGEDGRRQAVYPLERFAILGDRLVAEGPRPSPLIEAGTVAEPPAGARPLAPERRVRVPFLREGSREIAGLVEPRGAEEVVTPVEILIADAGPEVRCTPPAARLPASDSFELRLVNRSGERAIVMGPRFFTADTLVLHQGVVPAAGDVGYVVRAGTVGRMIMRAPPGDYLLSCAAVGGGDGPRSQISLIVLPPAR